MTVQRWHPPALRGEPLEVTITPQQANMLSGMCCGHTTQRIAHHLDISLHTAKSHAKHLYAALAARDRAHAVALVLSGQVTVSIAGRPGRHRCPDCEEEAA